MSARWLIALAALVLVAYLATGLRMIAQDEVGIIRRFGAVVPEPWQPGLRLGLPWGLDRVDRLARDRARTIAVGASALQSAPLARAPSPEVDDFLTGDLNLVTAQALIQFRVLDPVNYLFKARSADAALAALAESALTRALSGRGIDDVLTSGRTEVAEMIRREVQSEADKQELGVSVHAVRLGRVAPPAPVAPAFADAARARSDKRQAVTRAEEYHDRALADARARAREIADRAAATVESRVQNARGDADRFAKLLAEVKKSPAAARQRMYLEAVAELLPRFTRKVVVPPGQSVDLSVITDK
jgi:membrane protease subunit HflK